MNDNADLSAGASWQVQHDSHYRQLNDLLDGGYFVNLNQFADETIPGNIQFDLNNPDRKIYEGDRYAYDYDETNNKVMGWGQLAFKFSRVDYFIAAQLSHSSFFRTGHMRNGVYANDSYGKSATESFFNYSIKTGATYKLNGRNYLFANLAMGSRAPVFDNVFISPTTNNRTLPNPKSIGVASAEGGYLLKAPKIKGRGVLYYTQIDGESDIKRFYHDDFRTFVNYAVSGIDTRHVGAELSAEASLGQGFGVSAVAAMGQNFYTSNQLATVTQDNLDSMLAHEETVYAKNYRVGGSPEKAYAFGVNYRSKDYWSVYLDANFFEGNYVQINPVRRTAVAVDQLDENSAQRASILEQEKLDGAFTLDLSGSWSWKLNNENKNMKTNTFLVFNIGINNILNNKDFISTGFEQLRFDFTGQQVDKFDTKYAYAFGTNFFASITLRFN